MIKFDIDIDMADRTKILSILPNYTSAAIMRNNKLIKHNTGVYYTDIPHKPINRLSTIDHKDAEKRGYLKLDLLNIHLYNQVKDEKHLSILMSTEPDWQRLSEETYTVQLLHIGNYAKLIAEKMPSSIPQIAMFLAAIRPAKRHLMKLSWKQMNEKIWVIKADDGYAFSRSHAIAYAHLIVVNMNLLSGY